MPGVTVDPRKSHRSRSEGPFVDDEVAWRGERTRRLGQHVREVAALDGAVSELRVPGVQARLEGMLVGARDEQRQPHALEPALARPRLSQGDELPTDAAAASSG